MTNLEHFDLIGYACGWGAQRRETELGPQALREFGLENKLKHAGIDIKSFEIIETEFSFQDKYFPVSPVVRPLIEDQLKSLADAVSDSMKTNRLPCVLGGDHTMAIGTFSGAISALKGTGDFGLLWLDAHMDAHTPETSPSMAYHGMPIASLLGYGDPGLTNIHGNAGKLKPENLILLGIRSFEEEERTLLDRLGVRIYFDAEIKQRGFEACFQEALNVLKSRTTNLGLSVDLDLFDPEYAPGVGSPEADGLNPDEVLKALKSSGLKDFLRICEISEYNPIRDINFRTANVVKDLLETLFNRSTIFTHDALSTRPHSA